MQDRSSELQEGEGGGGTVTYQVFERVSDVVQLEIGSVEADVPEVGQTSRLVALVRERNGEAGR
jgi:hypothetical protein